jgi:hypothetical protein
MILTEEPRTAATTQEPHEHCIVCREQRGCRRCDACDRPVCQICEIVSEVLPGSFFCSSRCRNEAELAAEQARISDLRERWR